MKKYFCLFGLCVLFSLTNLVFAQEVRISAQNANILQSSFTQIGTQAWGAGGAYIARKGLPTAAFLNPAGLQVSDFSVYVESGRRLKSDYVFGIDLDNQIILPGFAGILIPFNQFSFSLGYANLYDINIDIGEAAVTTEVSPDGTGAVLSPKFTLEVHSFHGSLKYEFKNKLSFGITALLNYLRDNQKLGEANGSGADIGLGIIGGSQIMISDKFVIGMGFRYNSKIKYKFEFSGDTGTTSPGTIRGTPIFIVSDFMLEAKFPWSMQTGITFRPSQAFTFSAMVDYQNWSTLAENFKNKTQFHLGVDYQHSEEMRFSIGFFTMNSQFDGETRSFFGEIDQRFLTTGISLKVTNQFRFSASVLDAHLLTDNDFQQTYIMAGLQYGLE